MPNALLYTPQEFPLRYGPYASWTGPVEVDANALRCASTTVCIHVCVFACHTMFVMCVLYDMYIDVCMCVCVCVCVQ